MVNAPATALEGAQAAAETMPISDKKQSELNPVISALETDAEAADAAAHAAPVKMPRPSVHQAIPLKAAEKKTAVAVAPTQANPKQAGFLSADAEQKPTQKSSGDSFVEELKQKKIQIVDNRKQSGIVWIPYDKDKKAMIESIVSKYKLTASLEKRGAIATGNRPAWRVMI